MENKYKAGDVVYERIRPTQKLIIKRFLNGIYYCMMQEHRNLKELVFLESELKPDLSRSK